MFVGLGGNNGTTVTGGIIANRENLTWTTREGEHKADYFGSLTQSSTSRIGNTRDGKEVTRILANAFTDATALQA
jgi:myo-inositol-1-phosphate synthase